MAEALSEASTLADRETEIRRSRAKTALSAVLWTVGSAQVLFWSFAVGTWIGPGPLRIAELTAGALFAIALGFSFSGFLVRRRIEGEALFVAAVKEAGKRKRLAIYQEYLTLDDEVVVRRRIRATKLEGGELVLSVLDPALEGGTVERTLVGARPMLARVRDEIAAPPSPSGEKL